MVISFSIPEMLPLIENGLRQIAGEDLGAGALVKRQTIRENIGNDRCFVGRYYDLKPGAKLDLWWKSRSPDRRKIGQAALEKCFEVTIFRDPSTGQVGAYWGWPHGCWEADDQSQAIATELATLDGFPDTSAFGDFFVPQKGDIFFGWCLMW